jgi:rhamnogalacturonyl hydrolase YesR
MGIGAAFATASAQTTAPANAGVAPVATALAPTSAALPSLGAVLLIMRKVADWQLANPSKDPPDGWVNAVFYTGVMALARLLPAPNTFLAAMTTMAENNQWEPARRVYNADDHAVTQTYLELAELAPAPERLAPTRQRFDTILAQPKDDDLDFSKTGAQQKWSWCDALFMDPPAWVRLAHLTGDKDYLDSANRRWWVASDYLYDKNEHLFYRDSKYFTAREPNGEKIFWSRGNGWVIAGLARVIPYLPADYPDRPKYLREFQDMATVIQALQQPDGLWRPGLLDPAAHPQPETSGTGLFTFALAWGINHGLLDRAAYEPTVLRGWNALTRCVGPDGKLGNVQPVGETPRPFNASSTAPFGVGAFLLAGSEVYKMVSGPATSGGAQR